MPSLSLPTTAAGSPISKKERILFLDAIRGIAVLGILLMNSLDMAQGPLYYTAMNLNQPITGPNFYAWALETMVGEGSLRALFSILFGAGAILLTERLEKSRGHLDAADIYYRRHLWLVVFGLINAFAFLWTGDILYSYGICGLILFPFRKLTPKKLLIIAAALLAFGTYRENSDLYKSKDIIAQGHLAEYNLKSHGKLDPNQSANLSKWKEYREYNSSEGRMKRASQYETTIRTSTIAQIYAFLADSIIEDEGGGFYEGGWYDVMIFFFLGMALYKSGFITGKLDSWLYILIAALGLSISLLMNYSLMHEMYADRFDRVKMVEGSAISFYEIKRLLQSMGYLSLFILLNKFDFSRRFLNVFAAAGQMAFTNYLSQSIIMTVIFIGFGWFGTLQRYQVYEVVGCVWLFQITFSHIWLRYFQFGPFEWIWRSLTYQKMQPFLKFTREKSTYHLTNGF